MDFHLSVYSAEQLSQFRNDSLIRTGKALFAHIVATSMGVSAPSKADLQQQQEVPFCLTVEPLVFGVLPQSMLSVMAFLALVCIIALGILAPCLVQRLELIAVDLRSMSSNDKYKGE